MASVDLGGDSFSLNLYPILDVFSILIVFLLMNFSTQGQSVESKVDLELPKSTIKLSLDSSASVSVTKGEIVIQGNLTIPIDADGDVPEDFREQGAIRVAYEEFKKLAESQETLRNRDQKLELTDSDIRSLVLEADKTTEFKLLKRIMLSAQQADFTSWKLAVDKIDIN